tara:strand:- start:800 stop:1921 length:1122 start_codon:yes stop_codon:yes gene_type:complete
MAKNIEWLDSNNDRAYPFKENVTLSNGEVDIPNNFIIDAIFSGADENLRYRMHYIEVGSGFIQCGIGDNSGNFLGVINVSPTAPKHTSQFFQPEEEQSLRGRVVFGAGIATVAAFEAKRHFFGFSSLELEPSTVVPAPGFNGVTTLRKDGDNQADHIFTGDVVLQEGDGISIVPIPLINGFSIGASRVFQAECPDDLADLSRCANCIKYINGLPPDNVGNFNILGTEFIKVVTFPGESRIEISFIGDVDCCCTACEEVGVFSDNLDATRAMINVLGVSASTTLVSLIPTGGPAGGLGITLSVITKNGAGNVLPNVPIEVITPAGVASTPITGITDGAGIFTSTISTGVPGAYMIQVMLGGSILADTKPTATFA